MSRPRAEPASLTALPLPNMNPTSQRKPSRPLAAIAAAAVALCLGSCGIFEEKPHPSLVEPRAAVPRDFLFSWHEPYNEWMDTPVRVYYNEVPLDCIFENQPFTRLSYQWVKRPEEVPLVSIDSMGITRRQLLWSIAHDYNLHMSLKTLPDGHPNTVLIRDRGNSDEIRIGHIDR